LAISIASNNFALIVSRKHGGLIEEIGAKKLTLDQIYQGSYLQLIHFFQHRTKLFLTDILISAELPS